MPVHHSFGNLIRGFSAGRLSPVNALHFDSRQMTEVRPYTAPADMATLTPRQPGSPQRTQAPYGTPLHMAAYPWHRAHLPATDRPATVAPKNILTLYSTVVGKPSPRFVKPARTDSPVHSNRLGREFFIGT